MLLRITHLLIHFPTYSRWPTEMHSSNALGKCSHCICHKFHTARNPPWPFQSVIQCTTYQRGTIIAPESGFAQRASVHHRLEGWFMASRFHMRCGHVRTSLEMLLSRGLAWLAVRGPVVIVGCVVVAGCITAVVTYRRITALERKYGSMIYTGWRIIASFSVFGFPVRLENASRFFFHTSVHAMHAHTITSIRARPSIRRRRTFLQPVDAHWQGELACFLCCTSFLETKLRWTKGDTQLRVSDFPVCFRCNFASYSFFWWSL